MGEVEKAGPERDAVTGGVGLRVGGPWERSEGKASPPLPAAASPPGAGGGVERRR